MLGFFVAKTRKTVRERYRKARFKNASFTFGHGLRAEAREQTFATESRH